MFKNHISSLLTVGVSDPAGEWIVEFLHDQIASVQNVVIYITSGANNNDIREELHTRAMPNSSGVCIFSLYTITSKYGFILRGEIANAA